VHDVVPRNRARECFVLHPLSNGFGINLSQGLAWLHQRSSSDKSAQLIAGKQGLLQLRLARHAGVVGVAQDGPANLLVDAALGQYLASAERMVFSARIFLIIEVMDQSDDRPSL